MKIDTRNHSSIESKLTPEMFESSSEKNTRWYEEYELKIYSKFNKTAYLV